MKRKSIVLSLLAIVLLSGYAYAAKTSLSDVWMDKQQHIVVRKIAVFWVARNSQNRLVAENEFVRKLKERGIIAMPAYVIIPPDKFVDRETIMAKVRDLGVDTVITLRPVNKLSGKEDFPKTGPAGPSDLSGYYQFVYDQPVTDESGAMYMETVLFDAASGIRVWAARSVTKVDAVDRTTLDKFIDTLIERLADDKIIH